ncbi:anthranilate synthase component I [Thermosinus carboxydivorans]|nr:anthranilate synthase component I [Thermosinus carboxydivorans]
MQVFPAKAEFCRLAQTHNIVPVYTRLATDMETPVSLYYKILGDDVGFILESAENGKTFGRYSFIGALPFAHFRAYHLYSEITVEQETVRVNDRPMLALRNFLNSFSYPALSGLPPFIGGAVGYFAYEIAATWERIRGQTIPEDMILAELLFCQVLAIVDHLTHCTTLVYLVRLDSSADVGRKYDQAVDQLRDLWRRIQQQVKVSEAAGNCAAEPGKVNISEQIKQQFMAGVRKAKEYIAAGDIFQVVLSQPFRVKLNTQPFALYRRLRQVNPSPYMFYVNFGNHQLIGASPERLVKLEGDRVLTCPIAGTRPRGKDAAEDDCLAADLLADIKERAEHAMLVDLGRNDVGRVSLPGTVRVERLMQVEKFSHVMHLVSEVSGRLDPQFSALDVLAACFPAGTVSGAPKVRAMEIINELETDRRGIYAGAVGYLDFRGNMDTCIAIRTMAIDGDEIVIQTGAGIVADSVPEKEFQEVLHKAQALFQVIAEAGNHGVNYR